MGTVLHLYTLVYLYTVLHFTALAHFTVLVHRIQTDGNRPEGRGEFGATGLEGALGKDTSLPR